LLSKQPSEEAALPRGRERPLLQKEELEFRGAPMTSAFKSVIARPAMLAALGLLFAGGSASAADLGGNCCADLEERIAELEATTARKGNRKVSLTVSGWVNEAVFFWDDGSQSNVYVGTNSLEQSRFRFTGDAKISPGWSAGYTLEVGVVGQASNGFNQANDSNTVGVMTVRKSNWFLKSDQLGKLTVGLEGEATYHLLDDADASNTRNFADAEAAAVAMAKFKLKSGGQTVNGLLWTDVMRGGNNSTPGQGGRRNIVRYDSPALMGFVVTASWGENDLGSVALTYKAELGDFLIVARGGYAQDVDETTQPCHKSPTKLDCDWYGAAGTIMHKPTGLYVYSGFGEQKDNHRGEDIAVPNNFVEKTDTTWFVQGGIEQKFTSLGKTTVFGEYRHDDAGTNLSAKDAAGNYVHDSSLNFYAAGVVQNIEAAAMDLYVIYRHGDGDVNFANAGAIANTTKIDNFDMVITGAMIKF
jgi:hypothetical protein